MEVTKSGVSGRAYSAVVDFTKSEILLTGLYHEEISNKPIPVTKYIPITVSLYRYPYPNKPIAVYCHTNKYTLCEENIYEEGILMYHNGDLYFALASRRFRQFMRIDKVGREVFRLKAYRQYEPNNSPIKTLYYNHERSI